MNENIYQNTPLVCYLFTKFDDKKKLLDFINNYKKYDSGVDHKLLICFKLIDKDHVKTLSKHLISLKYIEFIDPVNVNDYDFGSYKRISEKYYKNDILFLNSHSYPMCGNWLKKLIIHKKDNNIIATSASFESLLDSIKLKNLHKFFSYLLKKNRFKKDFNNFPNPHIRTSSFFIKGKCFYEFIKDKTINDKYDTWKMESGKNSLTNYFKNKKYDLLVVNSDGNKFFENEWYLSQTYNFLSQSKTIISDKHTRKYLNLDSFERAKSQFKTWGL